MPPTIASSSNLKRKVQQTTDEIEATDKPRKLPAFGAARPLQPSRTATNVKLTVPRAPPSSTLSRSTVRAGSAPPRSVSSSSINARPRPNTTTTRTVSGTATQDKRFADLQSKVNSIDSARAADSARLAEAMEAERSKVAELQANHLALSRQLAAAKSQELNQRQELSIASDEIINLKKSHAREIMDLEMDMKRKERELRDLADELRLCRGDLEREREAVSSLKSTISHQSTAHLSLTTQNHALQAQQTALESQLEIYASTVSNLTLQLAESNKLLDEAKKEVRDSEGVRRKLHNMVQELKGNIRVFCRVRPALTDDEEADIVFPDKRDHKEIVLASSSENAMGQERKEVYNFGFDRVFEPQSTQADVFEEISQLAQSCTDGYNVCIFAYGQTGSGKSFTMEGGETEATAGMIPRAVEQVFAVTNELKSKGWEYTMEGQFLEIYNETINDLLGKAEFDKKKHEIKHDTKTRTTRVTDLNTPCLTSPSQVRNLLATAHSRRTTAATLMNERSSRSHSVFTLRIKGTNAGSGETCEGCLNLVDLAGSERLNASGAGSDKERLKETQNINRSLSALGDVIAALGEKGDSNANFKGDKEKHIPYRNSKLTYLLQYSLSGNSKTLMVLNLSPLAAHLNESLTSLRFATKVNNTTIGTATAKKQIGSGPSSRAA